MKQQTTFLRLAEAKDAQAVLDLSRELYEASVYGKYIPFNENDTLEYFYKSLEMDKTRFSNILLEDQGRVVGFISCSCTEQLFNKSELIGLEMAFWITPEYRTLGNAKKLLQAYYYWAKLVGCKIAVTGTLRSGTIENYKIKELN